MPLSRFRILSMQTISIYYNTKWGPQLASEEAGLVQRTVLFVEIVLLLRVQQLVLELARVSIKVIGSADEDRRKIVKSDSNF